MSEIRTTDFVCQILTDEANQRAEGMEHAGVPERAQAYRAMTFEARGMSEFVASTNQGDLLDLIDMVLDAVEERHALAFTPHRDGGGVQTIHWCHA
jgi:hypothetical protein